MPEFHFEIVETNQGGIVIEADNYDDAVKQAQELYYSGSVMWGDPEQTLVLNRSYE